MIWRMVEHGLTVFHRKRPDGEGRKGSACPRRSPWANCR